MNAPTVEEMLSQLRSGLMDQAPQALTRDENQGGELAPDAAELKASAELLLAAGDMKLARNILKTMVQNGVLVGWALRTLGMTLEEEHKLDQARRCYQDAIAFEPHLEAYRCLASLELSSRNDAAAADALERALNLSLLSTRLRFELHRASGNCWLRARKVEKAEMHYRKALQMDPASDQIASNLGALFLQAGRIREAQRAFEDALVANPSNPRALAGLGSAILADGRKREAHDHFAKSLECDLNQPTVVFHLVKCAYEIKSYATAARLLGQYVDIAPVNPNLLYSLGGLQFHLGRIDEAGHTVARILRMQPSHSGALELQKLISRYQQGASR